MIRRLLEALWLIPERPRWQVESDRRAAEEFATGLLPVAVLRGMAATMMHEMMVGFGWAMLTVCAGAVGLRVLVKVVFH